MLEAKVSEGWLALATDVGANWFDVER